MSQKLFVANLAYAVTSETLREVFEGVGAVVDARVVQDRATGQSRGFAFVEMGSADDAAKAIQSLNGQTIEGRPITVREAEERGPRGGGGRGFGGGGGAGRGGFGGGGRGGGGGGGRW
jgi:RNA recognition motif-containing protein